MRSKVVKGDGSTIQYYYDDEQLQMEERRNSAGALTRVHKYFYDNNGNVQYFLLKDSLFTNKDVYYLLSYVYDGLGNITDLVLLRNAIPSGTEVLQQHIQHYEYDAYDAYGNILAGSVNKGDAPWAIIDNNPIAYKGYYYDSDLNWYYLGSRFYDPEIGRFINADDVSLLGETPSDLTDKNLYAYCDNNPIMRKDSNGEFWHIAVGAALGAGLEMVSMVLDGSWGNSSPKEKLARVGGGALVGAATATLGPAAGAVVSGGGEYAKQKLAGKTNKEAGKSAAVSAGLSFVGGKASKTAMSAFKNFTKKNIKSDLKKLIPNKKNLSTWKNNNFKLRGKIKHRITSYLSTFYSAKLQLIYSGTSGKKR